MNTMHLAQDSIDLPQRQITRARTWTGDTEWYTPADILEAAVEVMGGIDLDPASSDAQQAQAPVKASQYFTIENNGLERPWCGRVWLNPPYARGWVDLFVNNGGRLSVKGNVHGDHAHEQRNRDEMVADGCRRLRCFMLSPGACPISQSGEWTTGSSAPSHPHTLFYFGPDVPRFVHVFGCLGLVFPAPYSPNQHGGQHG
jgi:ParB family chromosome partitioning protein